MTKPRNQPLPDFDYIDEMVRRFQQKKPESHKFSDSELDGGYWLNDFEFEGMLLVLMQFRSFLEKTPPGPKFPKTLWEAFSDPPQWLLQLRDEQAKYVAATGKERGSKAHALRSVAPDDPDKQDTLRKRWEAYEKFVSDEFAKWEKATISDSE